MSIKQAEEDIQKGTFRPVYLIYGPEAFLRQKLKQAFRNALAGQDELNYTYREGAGTEEDEIRMLAGTIPFMADKRLILLENTGWGKKGAEGLAGDIPELPDSTVLVLLEAEAAEKAPLFQAASQFGLCVLCEAPSRQEVKNDCRQAFESRGYEIEGAALDLFYERCGGDLATMEGEKEKLMAYVLPEKMIRRSHVETITHQTTTGRVFDMIHAMARGRTGEAFRLYEDLKTLKEAPSGILSLIVNQVGQLYAIRELDERGMSQREIEGLTRFNSYAVKAGIPRSRAFSSRLWKKKWERCLEYELASRSGRMEAEIAVELALIEMSLR